MNWSLGKCPRYKHHHDWGTPRNVIILQLCWGSPAVSETLGLMSRKLTDLTCTRRNLALSPMVVSIKENINTIMRGVEEVAFNSNWKVVSGSMRNTAFACCQASRQNFGRNMCLWGEEGSWLEDHYRL